MLPFVLWTLSLRCRLPSLATRSSDDARGNTVLASLFGRMAAGHWLGRAERGYLVTAYLLRALRVTTLRGREGRVGGESFGSNPTLQWPSRPGGHFLLKAFQGPAAPKVLSAAPNPQKNTKKPSKTKKPPNKTPNQNKTKIHTKKHQTNPENVTAHAALLDHRPGILGKALGFPLPVLVKPGLVFLLLST